ncbi:AI-2E family transporter [candidate division WWE3 bacterium]|nr:AI-2E family transporter [candidate division WWE3 bacterium]
MNKNIVISTKTILIFIGIVALGALLFQIRDIILQLLVALILALSIEPGVTYMVKQKIPRWVAVGTVFTMMVSTIVLFFTLAVPVIISQTRILLLNLPSFIDSLIKTPELKTSLDSSLTRLAGDLVAVTFSIFSNALAVATLFIFTLYLSLDLPNVKRRFLGLFSEDIRDYVEETWYDIETNLSRWIKGQLLLMLAVGLVSYLGLLFIRLPYALPLALIAGILEVVPVLGPIIATFIASVVGFSISPVTGILVVALFTGIQQLENNLLVPRIMQKIIGFNPLVTMLALLIGAKLFGVVGAIISIPVALMLIVIFHSLINLDLE